MASPISFGDAYLIGQLAFRLGRAFTKGRKSAPTELREVENQLYSLSTALCALRDAHAEEKISVRVESSNQPTSAPASGAQAENNDAVCTMLRNCQETLDHLDSIVKKYGSLEPSEGSGRSFKRWAQSLKLNWKKIAWTTEGGDLATLRSQLTVHTNSLNLILGVAINSQAERLEGGVDHMSAMLKEIHQCTPPETFPFPSARFELYSRADDNTVLICGHAWLHTECISGNSGAAANTSTQIFICQCNGSRPHTERLAEYRMSPVSFPVRLSGNERTWMIYKLIHTPSNLLSSLFIRNLSLRDMADFEENFVQRLATHKAREFLRDGRTNMLAYNSRAGGEGRMLDIRGDTDFVKMSLRDITFSVGPTHIYSELGQSRPAITPIDSAEILVLYDYPSADAEIKHTKSVEIIFEHSTQLEKIYHGAKILLRNVQCFWDENGDEQTSSMAGANVEFRFKTTEAAKLFETKLDDMRLELTIIRLQYPRSDETVILTLQANEIHSNQIYITDADITIVQNTDTKQLRLIIVSRNGCSILSQQLAEGFVESLHSEINGPSFTSCSYWVQMDATGSRQIYRYPEGLTHLSFGGSQNDRLFRLGLAAISGTRPLQLLNSASQGQGHNGVTEQLDN